MRFSIIVPAHNAEKTIERCLRSICMQEGVGGIQVIVADDGSRDSTWELCERMRGEHGAIELVRSPGRGASAARNACLSRADGEVIGFCDSDDYYEDGMLAAVSREFESDAALDMCCTGIICRDSGGGIVAEKVCPRSIATGKEMFERVICDGRVMGSVCNKFYKKGILQGICFDESLSYCEDTHFNAIVMSRHGDLRCLVLDRALYNYMQMPQSVTHDLSDAFNEKGELRYIESMHRIEEDCDLTGEQRGMIRMACCKLAIGMYGKPEASADGARKERLRREMMGGFRDLVARFYRYGVRSNIKHMLMGMKYMVCR